MPVHFPDGYKLEQVRDAVTAKIQTIPDILRASLTSDQGPEMRDWQQVSVAADLDITSVTHTRHGNAPPTRTPTGSYASASRKAPTYHSTTPSTSTGSPPNSTTDANA